MRRVISVFDTLYISIEGKKVISQDPNIIGIGRQIVKNQNSNFIEVKTLRL